MIRFTLEFETPEDYKLKEEQLNGILSDFEDAMLRLPDGFDLYDSKWEEVD